jgi:anti-sigma regulatory factor (Ser/Thr protein kinase)
MSWPGGETMAGDYQDDGIPAPVLELAFDSGTLDALRTGVRTHACAAGLSEDRAGDVVLVVHELAANAVRHGAGRGRLRVWKRAGALHCQVEDGGPVVAAAPATVDSWPDRPGHGLWVVRKLADRMRILSGVRGTRATVAFNLPGHPGTAVCWLAHGQGLLGRVDAVVKGQVQQ